MTSINGTTYYLDTNITKHKLHKDICKKYINVPCYYDDKNINKTLSIDGDSMSYLKLLIQYIAVIFTLSVSETASIVLVVLIFKEIKSQCHNNIPENVHLLQNQKKLDPEIFIV